MLGHAPLILLRLLIVLLPLGFATVSAPAGLQARGCGIAVPSSDPELRASFARFDSAQTPTAARVCALFLNNDPGT